MGDHRASIKIQAEFHGVKREMDAWINYFPVSVDGVDERIIEFFQKLHEDGMEKYNEQMSEYYAEQNREEIERAERVELAKLQAKYPLQETQKL